MKEAQTEASVMHGVMSMLTARGWRVKRMGANIYGGKGTPDLYAIKDGLSIWVECKNPNPKKGKVSKEQREFARLVDDAGGLFIVARSVVFVETAIENLALVIPASNGDPAMTLKPTKGMRLEVQS